MFYYLSAGFIRTKTWMAYTLQNFVEDANWLLRGSLLTRQCPGGLLLIFFQIEHPPNRR
jgi:hypothetical protein